jgi:hypothetical protein
LPAATKSNGTEKYTAFEERRYTMRVKAVADTLSPPPDSRPQYEWRWLLDGTREHETGDPIEVRCWTSTIWNDTAGRESHLVLLAQALYGPGVTFEDWEELAFEDLTDQRVTAMVMLNPKGYPTIDKTTFRPQAQPSAPPPPRAATPPPAPVAPPAPPADVPLSERTRQRIGRLAAAEDFDDSILARYTASALGATWPDLTEAQGQELTEALLEGQLVPF